MTIYSLDAQERAKKVRAIEQQLSEVERSIREYTDEVGTPHIRANREGLTAMLQKRRFYKQQLMELGVKGASQNNES